MRLRPGITSALVACAAAAGFAGLAGCGSYSGPPSTSPLATTPLSTSPQAAVLAGNGLGLKLLARLDPDQNTVISPYSVQSALALALEGARGSTETQMQALLGNNSPLALASANRALASHIALASSGFPQQGHPLLDAAAGLWLQSGLPVKIGFTSALAGYYGAVPNRVDFAQPTNATGEINAWAAAHTGGRIQNLMSPASVSSSTKLVLTSAIYVKASWSHPFTAATTPTPFHLLSGASASVAMMQLPAAVTLPYVRSNVYQAVELPYRASNLAMLAVLPNPGHLRSLLQALTPGSFELLQDALRPTREVVAMPKLELALHADLAGELAALGMAAAFGSDANFSGITSAAGLKLQSVEHAAVMNLYPSGTTAAAATGIAVAPTAILAHPHPTLVFNRPYYLFLVDRSTGTMLFAARVLDPA